jgi:DNA-binding NarL/FixJ family response regulator
MIRVMIVDDQVLATEGLQAILSTAPHIDVVGVAHGGAQAVEMVPTVQPDLVLMDLKMPGMNGIHATRAIREKHPDVRVLVLTTYDADEWVFDAIRAGADGYLLKDSRRDDILKAIEGTVAGKTHVDPGVADKLFSAVRRGGSTVSDTSMTDSLSERELDVLRLMAQGLTNSAIAERLYLAEGTVRNYVSAILSKLGVDERAQAVALAWRYGLADSEG